MQAKQEKWDLYDQQGRKTGKTIQAGENVPYGYCLYCVGIWVIDSEKKILLTKRSSQKRYAPGKWENTGGHMISGETSRHAIVRELKEETGIQIEEDELIELGDNHIGQFLGDNYAVFKDVALDEVHLEEGETEDVIKVHFHSLRKWQRRRCLVRQCGITWLDIRMSFIVCSIKQILKSKPIQVYLQKRLCSENEERGAA